MDSITRLMCGRILEKLGYAIGISMGDYNSKYGLLKGISCATFYDNGMLKECMLDEYNELTTDYGTLVPKYGEPTIRTKYGKSLSFYQNGILKSIYLDQQTDIRTSIGIVPAELITFHQEGGILRIFPLNGKLSGYWSEEEEYELAVEVPITYQNHSIQAKVISIHFYPSQNIKSVTLWRKQTIELETIYGKIATNIGYSLYETGELQSIEPKKAFIIPTLIGDMKAFNINAIGIHADQNSLVFKQDGTVKEIVTITNQVEVQNKEGSKWVYSPRLVRSYTSEYEYEMEELKVIFEEDTITLELKNHQSATYSRAQCIFKVTELLSYSK
ncbi:hypothetical protein [Anaeromicropila herbilytica]|uniref:Uncharacterized protein n=1 Tax=Anaeromicropila herbilytica TaxID=2785025 RepID=A0A7R7IG95_9FIRM|nr:hypothetical protein [Anaeromicropila herbilytica]BCN32858.1 hypothetical protein bsdtb5_41530 [Anaeromicropila herbilytica]